MQKTLNTENQQVLCFLISKLSKKKMRFLTQMKTMQILLFQNNQYKQIKNIEGKFRQSINVNQLDQQQSFFISFKDIDLNSSIVFVKSEDQQQANFEPDIDAVPQKSILKAQFKECFKGLKAIDMVFKKKKKIDKNENLSQNNIVQFNTEEHIQIKTIPKRGSILKINKLCKLIILENQDDDDEEEVEDRVLHHRYSLNDRYKNKNIINYQQFQDLIKKNDQDNIQMLEVQNYQLKFLFMIYEGIKKLKFGQDI